MERKIPFIEGEYYHIYNRGVEKRMIYSTKNDYERFVALLYLANSTQDIRMNNLLRSGGYESIFETKQKNPLIAMGAFCLMPNHFHILATPLSENGLSRFMLKLETAYVMYFNKRNNRSGALFQGPFKSEHADTDRHLKYLFSYIHLNSAKLKDPLWKRRVDSNRTLRKFVETYPYSSFGEYKQNKHIITNPKPFPTYFTSKKELQAHITDWLSN